MGPDQGKLYKHLLLLSMHLDEQRRHEEQQTCVRHSASEGIGRDQGARLAYMNDTYDDPMRRHVQTQGPAGVLNSALLYRRGEKEKRKKEKKKKRKKRNRTSGQYYDCLVSVMYSLSCPP